MRYAEVVVARRVRLRLPQQGGFNPLGMSFHYEVPAGLAGQVQAGHLVEVPLVGRRVWGIVVALTGERPDKAPKPIHGLLDPEPALLPFQIELARWISREYVAHILDCLLLMLPPGLAAQLRRPRRAVVKAPSLTPVQPDRPPEPTPPQAEALSRILQGHPGQGYLLHGVTGSGKTEVYLRAVSGTLAAGGQAIVLVPEIALTPQTLERFAARFPGRLAVTHSQLSDRERVALWQTMRAGGLDVVIGPRSALFSPLARLGLIVLDEEHDGSYKENPEEAVPRPRYHARETARQLARLTGARLLLGSATPDLVSYHRARQGELTLLELPHRVLATTAPGADPFAYGDLPGVEVVDLRAELKAGNRSPFSSILRTHLEETLRAGRQAILFLNRRGTATAVVCRECGQAVQCDACSIPLTYHGPPRPAAEHLECHHCGRRYPYPRRCPHCGSPKIKHFGMGTQRLEQEVQQLFPQARTLRWDKDTARAAGGHEAIFRRFKEGEANVLIGTQMVAKGLDLPQVTLVGVVNADVALHLPDYRAPERTFQLLTQVAGRAGRSRLGGRVVIQTFSPDHYALAAAREHDYLTFYREELRRRETLGYPPFARLVRLTYFSRREDEARREAERLGQALRERARPGGVEVTGPAPAFFRRVKGYYRWHLFLRGPEPQRLLDGVGLARDWRIDVDPVTSL